MLLNVGLLPIALVRRERMKIDTSGGVGAAEELRAPNRALKKDVALVWSRDGASVHRYLARRSACS
jgi:hypothetical protein